MSFLRGHRDREYFITPRSIYGKKISCCWYDFVKNETHTHIKHMLLFFKKNIHIYRLYIHFI